jgi:hypothetical protein
MPFVPGCRHDIFVSYASETDQDKWVTQFVEKLGRELEELLGRSHFSARQSIYFDRREMRVGQQFPEELRSAAEHSALFIPILSQGYLSSQWCDRERIAFQQWLPEGAALADCLAPLQVRPLVDAVPPEFSRDRTNIFSLLASEYHPYPAGSSEWKSLVKKFAGQIYEKLKVLRLRYRPVYVGRSPDPLLGLQQRVASHLETQSFRTTRDYSERLALAVHFVGGRDGDQADQDRLDAIESTVTQGVTSIVFQPFGSLLSLLEEEWRDGASLAGKPVTGATNWIERKHEQELLDILKNELTRLAAQPEKVGGTILACDPLDEPKAESLRQALARVDCRISQVELRKARTQAERIRLWDGMLSHACALVYCWGEADQGAVARWEDQARKRQRSGVECWYIFEPDVPGKLTRNPQAFRDPAELARFLEAACK